MREGVLHRLFRGPMASMRSYGLDSEPEPVRGQQEGTYDSGPFLQLPMRCGRFLKLILASARGSWCGAQLVGRLGEFLGAEGFGEVDGCAGGHAGEDVVGFGTGRKKHGYEPRHFSGAKPRTARCGGIISACNNESFVRLG